MNTPLPARIGRPATRALQNENINCLEDLTSMTKDQLLALHGIGPKAMRIIEEALAVNGLGLLDSK